MKKKYEGMGLISEKKWKQNTELNKRVEGNYSATGNFLHFF